MGDMSMEFGENGGEMRMGGTAVMLEEDDGQMRLTITMGATKIAATAATALVAASLF